MKQEITSWVGNMAKSRELREDSDFVIFQIGENETKFWNSVLNQLRFWHSVCLSWKDFWWISIGHHCRDQIKSILQKKIDSGELNIEDVLSTPEVEE